VSPMDLLGEAARRLDAEVGGDEALERRARPAPVLAPRRRRGSGEAHVVAASPVTGRRAEGGKAGMAAVGRNSDAVDPRAAHDCDAPASFRARAEDGEGVVPDGDLLGPAALRDHVSEFRLLGGEVDSGHEQLGHVGDWASHGLPERFLQQRGDDLDRAVRAHVMGRACRAAGEAEDLAHLAHDNEIGLRIASVDGQYALHAAVSVVGESAGR